MQLSDLFEKLAFGELAQHKYGKTGEILPADYPALISHTNLGLTDLCKKFHIISKELELVLDEAVTHYVLSDLVQDIIQIEAVHDSAGIPVPLNDEVQPSTVFTVGYNTLYVPAPVTGEILHITYRAKHTKIASNAEPVTTELVLPDILEEALLSYVASRCYSALNNETGNAVSSFHFSKYQMICSDVDKSNYLNETRVTTNIKLYRAGFV